MGWLWPHRHWKVDCGITDRGKLWPHTVLTFGSNSSDTTSLSSVCPLTPPSTTTSSLAPSPPPTRSWPTTTPATSADGVAPRVSSTFLPQHQRIQAVRSRPLSKLLRHRFSLCLQLEDSCPPSWSRPTCPSLTTRPAPATDGGAAPWRAPWSALVAAASPAARWASKWDRFCPRVWIHSVDESESATVVADTTWFEADAWLIDCRVFLEKICRLKTLNYVTDIKIEWSFQHSIEFVGIPQFSSDLPY